MVHFVDTRQGRQTRTITGDQMGEFFIWDIGNGQVILRGGVCPVDRPKMRLHAGVLAGRC